MPSMANIVVKKNDGTTDITFTAVGPSSGDSVAAVWKSQSVGVAPAHQPELRLSSREGANGAKRVVRGTFQYPQIATNTTTSVTSVVDKVTASVELTFPKTVSQADINEAVSQFANLIDSTLIVDSMKAGYAPT